MRFALINSRVDIRHYLPSNYSQVELPDDIDATLIAGSDNAGWTMDGYVIPRLASGLYFAQEVTADDPAAHVLGQAFVALMRRQSDTKPVTFITGREAYRMQVEFKRAQND